MATPSTLKTWTGSAETSLAKTRKCSFSQGRQQISEKQRREQVGSHTEGRADVYNAGREGPEEDEAPGMEVSVVWMSYLSEEHEADATTSGIRIPLRGGC